MLSRAPFPGFSAERIGRLFSPLSSFRRIGLAVSGGPDSLAMMVLFCAWAPAERRPEAIVYTLDHGLRPESAGEAASVAKAAEGLGLACRVVRWTGPHPASGVQAAARKARYRLIGAAMARDGAEALAVAHHGDDQAETVMMRLARGSGAKGLAGMRPDATIEGVRVLRPLLEASRDELAGVVAASGLAAALDPSNADPRYERVRWRRTLAALAPQGVTRAGLSRLAGRMARLDQLAEATTQAFLDAHLTRDGFGVFALARSALAEAPEEVRVRALLVVLDTAGGGQSERLEAVEALAGRFAGPQAVAATLMGAILRAGATRIVVHREPGRFAAPPVPLIAGVPTAFDARFTLTAKRAGLSVSAPGAATRAEIERWLGAPLTVPMAALQTVPAVRDGTGTLVALGGAGDAGAVSVVVRDPRRSEPR